MYAVIKTGGKQYRVAEGDVIEIEHLSVKGSKTTFTPILVVTDDGNTVYGRKELREYRVQAKILGDAKGDKVEVFKYRPKSGYKARGGHRQLYSLIEITSIGGKQAKADKKTADEPSQAEGSPKTEKKTTPSKKQTAEKKPKEAAEEASGEK